MDEAKRYPKEAFFTRARSNIAARIPLVHPETGEKTDEWIDVLGMDSDPMVRYQSESFRRGLEIARISDPEKKQQAIDRNRAEEAATALAAWSFEGPCTMDAKIAVLIECPRMVREIIRVCYEDSHFFKREPSPSSPGPKSNSDSAPMPTAPNKPSEKA